MSARFGRVAAIGVVGVLGVLVAVLAGLLGWRATHSASSPAAGPLPLTAALDPPAPPEALVYVSGAVVQPGLYRLSTSARVADAIAAAGGLTADADLGHMPDLAATVHDGRQVNVPILRAGTARGGSFSGRIPFAQRVDVNTADLAELAAVPGMPLGLPEAIVDARATFGAFLSLSQLRTVLGLETGVFTAVRPYLRAGRSIR